MAFSGHLIQNVTGRAAIFAVAGLAALLLALPLSLWMARAPANLGPYERMGMEIGCVCGTCPYRPILTCGCGFADQMLGDLQEAVDAGLDDEQIMVTVIAEYGQAVRIKPDTSGFDLVAWLAPMAFLLVGGVAVAAILSRWQRQQTELVAEAVHDEVDLGTDQDRSRATRPLAASAEDRRYLDIVERELDDLIGRKTDTEGE